METMGDRIASRCRGLVGAVCENMGQRYEHSTYLCAIGLELGLARYFELVSIATWRDRGGDFC